MTVATPAIEIAGLAHRYGERAALAGVDLTIDQREIFAFLGPNGGGKTTLFRVLSTLVPIQSGAVRILGFDVGRQVAEVRRRIGVVFQAASLDRKLTVAENLTHQGRLYGLSGGELRSRIEHALARLNVADRARDRVETLSGGLRRRVELAKALISRPRLLLLDEPSTGLDPGARIALWEHLRGLQERDGVTVVLTTHLLEEAEKADRLAILDRGRVVAEGTPDALRATVGGDTVSIATDDAERLAAAVSERYAVAPQVVNGVVRIERARGHELVAALAESFPGEIRSITLGKPTLEDVFIARTGHAFWNTSAEAANG